MSKAQITVKSNQGKAAGSGTLISRNGKDYIITAAHNLVRVDPLNKDWLLNTDMYAYRARKGEQAYSKKFRITDVRIHSKYDGQPCCGFDIAIGKLSANIGKKNYTDENYSKVPIVFDCF